MHYPIDKELHSLYLHKLPANIKFYSTMNGILQMFKCESDDKVNVSVYETPGYQNGIIKTYVIEPKNTDQDLPCLLLFHGGGFLLRASEAHYKIAKEYTQKLLCKVVIVDYRLAPKHPFPAALMDCYTAFNWIHDHAAELGGDPNRMGLHGTSAGANLVAGLSLYIRDNGGPDIKLAAMVNPPYGFNVKTPSFYQMSASYPLAGECGYQDTAETLYVGNLNGQAPSYYAFPAVCPTLLGFPKSLIIVSEYDQLRDDGINFAQRLYAEGVPCELTVAPRVGHGFMVVNDPMTHQFAKRMADSFRNEFDMI